MYCVPRVTVHGSVCLFVCLVISHLQYIVKYNTVFPRIQTSQLPRIGRETHVFLVILTVSRETCPFSRFSWHKTAVLALRRCHAPETCYIATKRVDSIKAKKLSRPPRDLRGTCASSVFVALIMYYRTAASSIHA